MIRIKIKVIYRLINNRTKQNNQFKKRSWQKMPTSWAIPAVLQPSWLRRRRCSRRSTRLKSRSLQVLKMRIRIHLLIWLILLSISLLSRRDWWRRHLQKTRRCFRLSRSLPRNWKVWTSIRLNRQASSGQKSAWDQSVFCRSTKWNSTRPSNANPISTMINSICRSLRPKSTILLNWYFLIWEAFKI